MEALEVHDEDLGQLVQLDVLRDLRIEKTRRRGVCIGIHAYETFCVVFEFPCNCRELVANTGR